MPTLCSKPQNGFLDFLDFGPVGIGVRLSLRRAGGTAGNIHLGGSLFRNLYLFPAWIVGLAKTPIQHPAFGFAGIGLAPHHCIEE